MSTQLNLVKIKGIPTLAPEVEAEIIVWDYGWQQDMAEGAIGISTDIKGKRTVTINSKAMAINTLVFGIYQCEALLVNKPANDDGLTATEVEERRKIVRRFNPQVANFLSTKIKDANNTYDEEEVENEKKE